MKKHFLTVLLAFIFAAVWGQQDTTKQNPSFVMNENEFSLSKVIYFNCSKETAYNNLKLYFASLYNNSNFTQRDAGDNSLLYSGFFEVHQPGFFGGTERAYHTISVIFKENRLKIVIRIDHIDVYVNATQYSAPYWKEWDWRSIYDDKINHPKHYSKLFEKAVEEAEQKINQIMLSAEKSVENPTQTIGTDDF